MKKKIEIKDKWAKDMISLEKDFVEDVFKEKSIQDVKYSKKTGVVVLTLSILSLFFTCVSVIVESDIIFNCVIGGIAIIGMGFAIGICINNRRNKDDKLIANEKNEIAAIHNALHKNKYKNYNFMESLLFNMEDSLNISKRNSSLADEKIYTILTSIGSAFVSVSISLLFANFGSSFALIKSLFCIGMLFLAMPLFVYAAKEIFIGDKEWKKRQCIRMFKRYKLYKFRYKL